MTFLSLFSGIGGIDLGLERAGMRCVGQVEIDPFCRAVLAKHWPDVPRWDDVCAFTGSMIDGPVDLVCGGFPCQDVSLAGKGAGLDGQRSGLWWEFHRIIGELRPDWVLIENVPGLRRRGADDVLDALEALGYPAWPLVVGAEHVGAPHKRGRVWIVGYAGGAAGQWDAGGFPEAQAGERGAGESDGDRADGPEHAGEGGIRWPARPGEPQHGWEQPRLLALPSGRSSGRREQQQAGGEETRVRRRGDDAEPQRPVGGAAHGLPERLVRFAVGQAGRVDGTARRREAKRARWENRQALRAYGNAVVPQVVELIGRRIMEAAGVRRPVGMA